MNMARLALVTGSTSGIGLGIAKSLAEAGYRLILNGLGDPGAIDQALSEVSTLCSESPIYIGTDLTQPRAIEVALAEIIESVGPISVLVNNAGMQHTGPVEDFPVDKWDQIIALNLSAAFHTTRLCLPEMKAQDFGRIINIASVHGLVASTNKPAYVASKHGLIGLTKATALETAEANITCNAICPGWTETPLIQAQIETRAADLNISIEDGGRALLAEKQPSKRFVTTDQLGALTRFLCTDAASQITGASLPVDGGWTAQ
ncbi:MAG: 3-hydroxybutyrate dehydrogenase [Oceanospirillales bacterium TMED33]|nr:3-hydroxybutyrate dehydrogenase [Gammaproteobacteria bacterium]RPG22171.1 MAG: 3-hydroxybutyrate dehydrogenase [Oceanospirillales bacterium TMED33]